MTNRLDYVTPRVPGHRPQWLAWLLAGAGVASAAAVVIAAVLATVETRTPSDRSVAAAGVTRIDAALQAFWAEVGRDPTEAEGLDALLAQPAAAAASGLWRGPYLPELPNDPWGHPYVYRRVNRGGREGYVVLSAGPDGAADTPDDISTGFVPDDRGPAARVRVRPAGDTAALPGVQGTGMQGSCGRR